MKIYLKSEQQNVLKEGMIHNQNYRVQGNQIIDSQLYLNVKVVFKLPLFYYYLNNLLKRLIDNP